MEIKVTKRHTKETTPSCEYGSFLFLAIEKAYHLLAEKVIICMKEVISACSVDSKVPQLISAAKPATGDQDRVLFWLRAD